MELNKNNYRLYSIKAYDNPYCLSEEEFNADLSRTSTIKKMLSKFVSTQTVNTKLLINSVICFYNVFKHPEATYILAFKLSPESRPALNSVLIFLNLPTLKDEPINVELLQVLRDESKA